MAEAFAINIEFAFLHFCIFAFLHFCICIFDLRSKIDATRKCQSELYIPLAAPIFAVIAVIAIANFYV